MVLFHGTYPNIEMFEKLILKYYRYQRYCVKKEIHKKILGHKEDNQQIGGEKYKKLLIVTTSFS